MASNETIRAVAVCLFDDSDVESVITNASNQQMIVTDILQRSKERKNKKRIKIGDYVESTIPRYSDNQFREHFRMLPSVFEVLCSLISAALIDGCKLVSVRRKVLATVWLLANTESYRSVADRFNFSKGQLHSIVQSVCHALVGLKQEYIKWPTSNELEAMSNGWNRKRPGFPGVIGAIDGTYMYIPIQGCGGQDRDSYICRKGFPAMHLQVVCDSNHKFLDVYTGYPGSVHDARVFKNSNLGVHLESPDGKLPPNFHLLGDSAYPNSSYLLTPFRDNGHLTSKEKRYNKMHSEIRVTVEHSIGLLKGKFRRLKYLAMGNYAEIPFIIFACCILHNFLLMSNDTDGDDFHFCCNESEEASEVYENADNLDRSGDVKRREIADLL